MWVLGGVQPSTGQCFLLPCPNNQRGADVLLPLIQRWVLPGSIIHTDEWGAYNQLTRLGYTHDSVNHSLQFVDPATGVHTNTQEGLWHHLKKQCDGSRALDDILFDFMFRRRFNATAGVNQIVNAFNGFISALTAM